MNFHKLDDLIEYLKAGIRWPNEGVCSGTAIYQFISSKTPSDEELKTVANELAKHFPIIPLSTHAKFAKCVRNIFGIEAAGVFNKENSENLKALNWDIPFKFISYLIDNLVQTNNYYALAITYEVTAHRFGDLLVTGFRNVEETMLDMYEKSVDYAQLAKSNKQMSTPYYWAATYFFSLRNVPRYADLSLLYYQKSIDMVDKYEHDSIIYPGEMDKIRTSLFKIKHFLGDLEWENYLFNKKRFARTNTMKYALYEVHHFLYGYPIDPEKDYTISRDYTKTTNGWTDLISQKISNPFNLTSDTDRT